MRTVSGTVRKVMTLMSKLSFKTLHDKAPRHADVHKALEKTVNSVNGRGSTQVRTMGERVPPVDILQDPLQQVLLNVVLDAQQAVGKGGEVWISTERTNGLVVTSVADEGSGILPTALRTLFQPFRTRKEGGLGGGLFQSKEIIDAHRGAIGIDSDVGLGACVRIALPVAEKAKGERAGVQEQS